MSNDREINLTITDYSGQNFELKTVNQLSSLIDSELEFWHVQREIVREKTADIHALLNIVDQLQLASQTINDWESSIDSWDQNTLQQQINNLVRDRFRNFPNSWLYSGHVGCDLFVQLNCSDNKTVADAFIQYLTKRTIPNSLNNAEIFKGVLCGYEFEMQDSQLLNRRERERNSIGRIRSRLESETSTLFEEVSQFKGAFNEWDEETKENFDRLYRARRRLALRQERHKANTFNDNMGEWTARIEELETLYNEKLRLAKPADYWRKAARRYGCHGGLWTVALVALISVGLMYFREFFLTWLEGKELGVELNTLQGVVLLGGIASLFAYMIRVLSRMVFSSFHLMRDAQEREQLTYLYLALSNENVVDETSREIVLQALFSRTDTGLLGQDSGPTMPTAHEALQRIASKNG